MESGYILIDGAIFAISIPLLSLLIFVAISFTNIFLVILILFILFIVFMMTLSNSKRYFPI